MSPSPRQRTAQAWIELRSADPAAVSALAVARARLSAGRMLNGLRRFRVIELQGALPERALLESRLHESSWFYNPHKETCVLRTAEHDPAPAGGSGETILVVERGDARMPAAERWWRHAARRRITVRQGVAWVLEFKPETDAPARALELMTVKDQAHGLFVNPHAQMARHASGAIPLSWISDAEKESS